MSTSTRRDFIGPILLAIFAYLASMLTRAFQRSIEQAAIAKAAERKESLKYNITDGLIKNENEIRDKLQDESTWQECASKDPVWWNGKAPKNIWEEIVSIIWEKHDDIIDSAAGFEYWCDIVGDKESIGWHIDKDIYEFEKNDVLVTPLKSAVYYGYNHFFDSPGGYLYLVDGDYTQNPHDYDVLRRDEIVAINPEHNRAVYFNSSKWHKVSPMRGSGKRFSFSVNAYTKKPNILKRHGHIEKS